MMSLLDLFIPKTAAKTLVRARVMLTGGDGSKAFQLLIGLARKGHAEAQYEVGKAYAEGHHVPKAVGEAISWLTKAAASDITAAQILLARLAMHGQSPDGGNNGLSSALTATAAGGDPDWNTALRWALQAASAGSAEAQAIAGHIFLEGPAALRDRPSAAEMFRKSADGDCPSGYLGLAMMLSADAKSPEDQAEIARLFRLASDAGIPTAQYMLGVIIERGLGVPQDTSVAAGLYRLAAESGVRDAQARYGLALLQGNGVPRDSNGGESWLRRAGLAGDFEAAALVGDLYSSGGELPPNFVEAAFWYRIAAEGGHRIAARILGLYHVSGAGVAKDREEALKWFRRSADAGDVQSEAEMAVLVCDGAGGPEDGARIRRYYETKADQEISAAFGYALCLLRGIGGSRDAVAAARWLR
jgi:TPR repeat protein